MAKSGKMTYRDWLNPGLRQAGIGQAPKHLNPNLQTFKELRNQNSKESIPGLLKRFQILALLSQASQFAKSQW
jgi:hypothetical protein